MFLTRHNLRRVGLAMLTIGALIAALLLCVVVAQAGFGIEMPATPRGAAMSTTTTAGSALTLGQKPPAQETERSLTDGTAPWVIPTPVYKIYIAGDGIYQLSYHNLSAAGLPVSTLDPRTFRVFYRGEETAIRVIGEEDGHFDSGDAVVFYARGVDAMYFDGLTPINKYTGTNVYWLTYGGTAGRRMAIKDGSGPGDAPEPFRHIEHLEFNLSQVSPSYFSQRPFEPDAEHWYRDWYSTGSGGTPTRQPYNFTANNAASGAYSATFTASILGENSVQHRVRFYLNGNLMLDDSTSGYGKVLFQTSVQTPQSFLVEGTNAISVELASADDWIYLNWLKLEYYDQHSAEGDRLTFSSEVSGTWRYSITQFSTNDVEVYDVSDLHTPQIISSTVVTGSGPYTVEFGDPTSGGARYFAVTPAARQTPAGIEAVTRLTSVHTPADLLSPAQGADYIIITHRNFFTEALRLANYRSLRYRVKLVDVQTIYDQFNGGLMSAESIHDFLAYAYATWVKPAPSYVVLMGDGSYDMRLYKGLSSNATFIPPYLALADPSLGETAADNRFVTLVGDDLMPDMNIGRLPVNTVAEAAAMVDKIIAYETQCNCATGGWNENLLFVADDLEGGGGDFYEYSDKIAFGHADPPTDTISLIPAPYTVTRAYLGQTCDVAGNPSPAAGCRYMITSTLNITGALFVSYVGHSTKGEWAAERLLDLAAVNTLAAKACLPIMVPMTCYEGSFHEASKSQRILAEVYTRAAGKGAIASFSPTGFGLVSGHDLLEQGLFLAVFHNGIDTLGAAVTWSKQFLLDNDTEGSYADLMDTFLLIGDPALRMKIGSICETPTGIALADLDVRPAGRTAQVSWRTNSEADILGFNILRAEGAGSQVQDSDYIAINPTPIFAEISGGNDGARYTYDDERVAAGRSYWYKLEVLQLDGSRTRYGPVSATMPPWRAYLPQVWRSGP